MKRPRTVGLILLSAGSLLAVAGQAPTDASPVSPTILGITQEAVVPGKLSAVLKNHAAAMHALQQADTGRIALGLVSVSGPEEVWTFDFHQALAEFETERAARTPALQATLEQLDEATGGLVAHRQVQTATFLKDLSYQADFDWSQARYLDVIVVHVRPGHHPEYLELRRMSRAGHTKGGLDGPLHVFKVNTGVTGLAWMIVRPLRSLRQHDELREKGFGETLTPEEDAKMVALRAASLESAEERFFRIEPRISRVPASWARRNAEFWSGTTP